MNASEQAFRKFGQPVSEIFFAFVDSRPGKTTLRPFEIVQRKRDLGVVEVEVGHPGEVAPAVDNPGVTIQRPAADLEPFLGNLGSRRLTNLTYYVGQLLYLTVRAHGSGF